MIESPNPNLAEVEQQFNDWRANKTDKINSIFINVIPRFV